MKTPKTFLSRLLRDSVLLTRAPIDFLLTFNDPLDKTPELKEVDEDAHNLGQSLLKELKNQATGGMKVYFVGSAFFKIPGLNNDIDFLAEYATNEEKKKWRTVLIQKFGKPTLENPMFSKWDVAVKGFTVELVLSHPKFKIFKKAFDAYIALSNAEILAEYEELKRDSVGVTQREYNRRQIYFFDYYVKKKMS